ncbi:MAG: PEGA domain-containing protein [Acidobacteriota bacterium]
MRVSIRESWCVLLTMATVFLAAQETSAQGIGAEGPMKRGAQGIGASDVEPLISSMTQNTRMYVLRNINRPDLVSSVEKWEASNKVELTIGAKASFVVDFLSAESIHARWYARGKISVAGHKLVPIYLNGIITADELPDIFVSWEYQLGNKPDYVPTTRNKYGQLKVESLPEQAEVLIDGKFVDYSGKTFVLVEGPHPVIVRKKPDYIDHSETVNIEGSRKHTLTCQLAKQQ